MQGITAQNETKSQIFHDFLSKTYLPQLQEHLGNSHAYLDKEAKDFQRIESNCDQVLDKIQDKKNYLSKTLKQLNERIQKESELQKKAEQYKKMRKDELSATQKTIDSISGAMKEACGKINAEALAKIQQLPAGMDSFMGKLFFIIYNEDPAKFIWGDFKLKALIRDKGEDFQSRLANFQFRVSQQKEDLLLQMKEDPVFNKTFKLQEYSEAFIDIADWIHYAVTGIDGQRKKDEAQAQFDKIAKEFANRNLELQNLLKAQQFWQHSLDYTEQQITFFNQLIPDVKGISMDISGSKKNLESHIQNLINETKNINSLMTPP